MQIRPEQNVTFKMYFSFTSQRRIYSFSVFTYILTAVRQFSLNIVYYIYIIIMEFNYRTLIQYIIDKKERALYLASIESATGTVPSFPFAVRNSPGESSPSSLRPGRHTRQPQYKPIIVDTASMPPNTLQSNHTKWCVKSVCKDTGRLASAMLSTSQIDELAAQQKNTYSITQRSKNF